MFKTYDNPRQYQDGFDHNAILIDEYLVGNTTGGRKRRKRSKSKKSGILKKNRSLSKSKSRNGSKSKRLRGGKSRKRG